MTNFGDVVRALIQAQVRFLVSGVWGANYYAAGSAFVTKDQDLFLPGEAENLLRAWQASERLGLDLRAESEPLDYPRDLELAEAVVRTRGLTTATDGDLLLVDFSLVMGRFAFDDAWQRHRTFQSEGVQTPVASLADILAAKRDADRPKGRLFLASHAETLRRLLGDTGTPGS